MSEQGSGQIPPHLSSANEADEAKLPIPIAELPSRLGYKETEESLQAKNRLMEAMDRRDWDAIKILMTTYHKLAEKIVEQYGDDDFARAQIGLIVATGLAWQRAGLKDSYEAELFNAHIYARNMNFEEVVRALEAAMTESEAQNVGENELIDELSTEEIISICKRELPVGIHEELDDLSGLPADEVREEIASLISGYNIVDDPYDFFNRVGIGYIRDEADWVERKDSEE